MWSAPPSKNHVKQLCPPMNHEQVHIDWYRSSKWESRVEKKTHTHSHIEIEAVFISLWCIAMPFSNLASLWKWVLSSCVTTSVTFAGLRASLWHCECSASAQKWWLCVFLQQWLVAGAVMKVGGEGGHSIKSVHQSTYLNRISEEKGRWAPSVVAATQVVEFCGKNTRENCRLKGGERLRLARVGQQWEKKEGGGRWRGGRGGLKGWRNGGRYYSRAFGVREAEWEMLPEMLEPAACVKSHTATYLIFDITDRLSTHTHKMCVLTAHKCAAQIPRSDHELLFSCFL